VRTSRSVHLFLYVTSTTRRKTEFGRLSLFFPNFLYSRALSLTETDTLLQTVFQTFTGHDCDFGVIGVNHCETLGFQVISFSVAAQSSGFIIGLQCGHVLVTRNLKPFDPGETGVPAGMKNEDRLGPGSISNPGRGSEFRRACFPV
jgi:hypothetical protein